MTGLYKRYLQSVVLILASSAAIFALRANYFGCPDVSSPNLFSLLCYGKASLNCFESEEEVRALLTLVVGKSKAEKIIKVLQSKKIYSFGELQEIVGIGVRSVERIKRIFTLKGCQQ